MQLLFVHPCEMPNLIAQHAELSGRMFTPLSTCMMLLLPCLWLETITISPNKILLTKAIDVNTLSNQPKTLLFLVRREMHPAKTSYPVSQWKMKIEIAVFSPMWSLSNFPLCIGRMGHSAKKGQHPFIFSSVLLRSFLVRR